MTSDAIDITGDYFKKIDLKPRQQEIIDEIKSKTKFIPEKIIWESRYYDLGIGAFHVSGTWQDGSKDVSVILKIQGAKPNVSEVGMIRAFEKQNKSKLVRTPRIYELFPWDDEKQYEAIIMEHVQGKFIIEHGTVATVEQVKEFYTVLDEYKLNSTNVAWLQKPDKKGYKESFLEKSRKIRLSRDDKRFVRPEDDELILSSISKLDSLIKYDDLEFVHGHLSVYDVIKYKGQYVIFSNLFWKYRWPLYEFVFGYMWQMLELAKEDEKVIKDQMKLWQSVMKETETVKKYGERALKIALFERAVSALNLDFLLVPDEHKVKMRNILREEIKVLSTTIL